MIHENNTAYLKSKLNTQHNNTVTHIQNFTPQESQDSNFLYYIHFIISCRLNDDDDDYYYYVLCVFDDGRL